ncbi:MAG TPA: hypothetical protein VML75_09820 [Kofleriaceae bacterium]|nr:hypothetical protein [Kofleriaceae bacterium]
MRWILLSAFVLLAACDGGNDNTSAADAAPACPPFPPADGAGCTAYGEGARCTYDRCSDVGLVQAQCNQGGWSVTQAACDELTCQGQPCADGSICVAQVGGALLIDCRPHTCADGPLTSECVCGSDRGEPSSQYSEGSIFVCHIDCGADICP